MEFELAHGVSRDGSAEHVIFILWVLTAQFFDLIAIWGEEVLEHILENFRFEVGLIGAGGMGFGGWVLGFFEEPREEGGRVFGGSNSRDDLA